MDKSISIALALSFLTTIFVITNGNLIKNPNVFGDSELIMKIKGAIDGMKAPSERLGERNVDRSSVTLTF